MPKVRVYWNLHKGCFSVQDYKTSKVIAHKQKVHLTDVKFHVRKGGNQRVRDEGKKNVHAFMIGNLVDSSLKFNDVPDDIAIGREVTYNPYKYDTFVTCYEKDVVTEAFHVTAFAGVMAHSGKPVPCVFARIPNPNKSDVGLNNQQ